MRLVVMPLAGGGGREVYVNPDQVVCLIDVGQRRTQLVTTGLQGEASISLLLEMDIGDVARSLADAERTAEPRPRVRAERCEREAARAV